MTYLCKQLVKHDDGHLENRIETCQLSTEEIKSEIEKCENSMRIIDRDVDVNLLLCNLDMFRYYLKQIHHCYVNEFFCFLDSDSNEIDDPRVFLEVI